MDGKELSRQFDDWLQDLFKGSEQSKWQRMSVGGTSSSIHLRGKVANSKVLRRQLSLPESRKGFILGGPRELLSVAEEEEEERRHFLEQQQQQQQQLKRGLEWKSDRKLTVPIDPEKTLSSGVDTYDKDCYVRLTQCGLQCGTDVDVVPLLPGTGFSHFLPLASRRDGLNNVTMPFLVLGLSANKCSIDGFWTKDSQEVHCVEKGYSIRQIMEIVDDILLDTTFSGLPVAVAKRTHFKQESSKEVRGSVTSVVFLYSREQIVQELSRTVSGTLMLQKFVKSKGSRPWCVRVQWDAACATCKKLWVLTSTSEYVYQRDQAKATKVGQLWAAGQFQPIAGKVTESAENTPICIPTLDSSSSGSLHPLRGTTMESYFVHHLGTDTGAKGRCSVVSAKASMWPKPVQMVQETAERICKKTGIPFQQMVFDLLQDEEERWWILQTKSFSVDYAQLLETGKLETIQRDGWQLKVVKVGAKATKLAKYPRVLKKAQTAPLLEVVPKETGCPGDFCKGLPEDQRESSLQYEVSKRDIFLERAAARAQNQKDSVDSQQLSQEQYLEGWFTAQEARSQQETVMVCEVCFHQYCVKSEQRRRKNIIQARRIKKAEARTEKACLRLYEKFLSAERSKGQAIASLVKDSAENSKALAKEQASRKRKKRRRAQPSKTGTSKPMTYGSDSFDLNTARSKSSIASTASFLDGDRVVDRLLGKGTVVEIQDDLFCTIRFDNGAVEQDIGVDRLRLVEPRAFSSSAVRLSADELVGLSLPPQILPEIEESRYLGHGGFDLDAMELLESQEHGQEEAIHQLPFSARSTVPETGSGQSKLPGISKSFASMFVTEPDSAREEDQEDFEERLIQRRKQLALQQDKAGVLCPFGCGVRIQSGEDNLLSTSHAAWMAHVRTCASRAPNASGMTTEKTLPVSFGVKKVQRTIAQAFP